MPHNLGDYPPHSNALPTAPATSTAEPAEVARARQSLAALARDPFVILEAAVVITGLDEPRRDLVLTYFSAMFASSQEMHFPESLSGQPGQPLPSDARSVAPAGFSDDPFEVLQGAVVAAGLDAQQTDRLLMTYAVLLDPSMVPLVADARALPGNGNPPAAE